MRRLARVLLTTATAVLLMAATVACDGERKPVVNIKSSRADSILFDIGAVKDYGRMLAMTDTFEQAGVISPLNANRWRGVAYYRQGKYRSAEFYYKKALECEPTKEGDDGSYIKAARRLSELLLIKGDYEGALQVAMPAVAKMETGGYGSDIDFAILLNNIGCCQLNLGRGREAQESFYTARQHYINRWTTDSTGRGFQEAVVGTVYTSQAYINTRRFQEALYWIDRTEMLLGKYAEKPDARTEYFDEYLGRIEIMRAVAMQGLDSVDKAAQAYQRFMMTDYAKMSAGKIYANDYLLAAHRYSEAADNYRFLDQMLDEWGIDPTLDNIQLYLIPKLRANIGAMRRDSAMAIGLRLCDALDSAIVKNKSDDTAELATIYETHQKEAQIAQQQADMASQRLISSLIALALVIIFFSVYVFLRHRSAQRLRHAHQRLEEAHQKLQSAYDQLERTTAAKERIESELRIARDIQMSMVPHLFPDRAGLDLHASMMTAKEVGGDLYGYLMEGDLLYFCVGDVSGKGVPASLFMAQATRLFRTLAAQRMMPAEIITRMNAALTEDNEQGMFVTMFLGMVDLNTGRMNFCNAGHNPPVLMKRVAVGGTGAADDNGMQAANSVIEASFLKVESNAPIGLWPDIDYVGEVIESIKSCPLVVYSDGLTEAENPEQEQFGEERLLDLLRHNRFINAKALDEFLVDEVQIFRRGAEPNDDLTILCVRVD